MNKKIFTGGLILSLSAFLALGLAAGLSVGKESAEVKAATATASGTRIYIEDQTGLGWTNNGVDPVAHMWDLTFDASSGLQSISDMSSASATFGSGVSYGTDYVNATMSWTDGSHRQYQLTIPWYITSFKTCFFATENSNDRYWYRNGNSDAYQFTANRENNYKIYICSTDGYGPWWDGNKFRAGESTVTESGYSYEETTYSMSVAASPVAGGTVTGAGTYKKYENATVTATANSGYSFVSWSDSGYATHTVMMTSDTSLTATFNNLPKLATPTLVKDANNNITWSAIANAQSYSVSVDGVVTSYSTSDELKVDALTLPGNHEIIVTAIGDHTSYNDSDPANSSYTVTASFYLVGSFQNEGEWDTTHWVNAQRMSENTLKYSVTYSLSANDEVKAVWLTASSPDPAGTWTDTGTLVVDPLANIEYPVSKLEGGNIKFDRAGSYTITVEYENEGANLKYTVVANDYVQHVYKLVVGTGVEAVEYSMTINENTEFVANNVTLRHGQTVSIKKDGSADAGYTSKAVFNNNFDANGCVVANVTGTSVYVDVSAKTIWNGLDLSAGYHMLLNGNRVALTQQSESEWKTEAISFSNGDIIRFVDVKGSGNVQPVVFDAITVNPYSEVKTFNYVEGTGMVATAASEAAVYLQLNGSGNAIYFGSVDPQLSRAKKFATDFLSDIRGVCDYDGNTDLDDLKTAWQLKVTEFGGMATDYAGAQTILKNAVTTPSSVAEIRDFIELYVLVLDRHGNTQTLGTGYDFLESGISGARYTGAAQIFNETNLPLIVIIGVSVLAITSVGAVVYLKVRKHD